MLWNCNAFVQWFWEISGDPQFRKEYELLRKKQVGVCRRFFNDLAQIESLRVYPSQASFCLARLPDHMAAPDFCLSMLKKEGVYLRDCSNKTGLDQHYVRIAARINTENQQIDRSIEKQLFC
ncbi:uncharacterized protein METZ01_LOCUS262200 [marine metagenome]|uniref:Aminotransferase class I/classII large domain-containing protein n=1 Tax=marine metagenome TaxID=408172 RepID=A0A382JBW0_9ZZZZ